jgi:hypothetical protein
VPDARLVVVGDGAGRPELEAHARRLALDGAVRFLGWVDPDRLADLYGAAGIFALPSRQEGFGFVYVEAMAAGLPIVAARARATPEVVRDDVEGLLCPYGDVSALTGALIRLIGDRELRDALVANGRRRVEEDFTMCSVRAGLRSLLSQYGPQECTDRAQPGHRGVPAAGPLVPATLRDPAHSPGVTIAGVLLVALTMVLRGVARLVRSLDSQESLLRGWSVNRLWALGMALSTLVATVDALLGSRVVLIGLTMAGPCCALLTGRWLPTVVAATWTIGLAVLLGLPDGIWATGTHLTFLAAVATVALANTAAAVAIDRRRAQARCC